MLAPATIVALTLVLQVPAPAADPSMGVTPVPDVAAAAPDEPVDNRLPSSLVYTETDGVRSEAETEGGTQPKWDVSAVVLGTELSESDFSQLDFFAFAAED